MVGNRNQRPGDMPMVRRGEGAVNARKIALRDDVAEDPVIHGTRSTHKDGAWTTCGYFLRFESRSSATGFEYGWKGILVDLPATCLWCVSGGLP